MHNVLFDVSAKAFQKNLEKEANAQNREDFSDLELVEAEKVQASTSILQRLLSLVGSSKPSRSHIHAPKLKNKIV